MKEKILRSLIVALLFLFTIIIVQYLSQSWEISLLIMAVQLNYYLVFL